MTLQYAILAVCVLLLLYVGTRYWHWRQANLQPYTPALARIEGGGIKRGLTPAEGAILLGRPLHITLTLVIFEMLRKGFLRQVAADPLTVEVAEAFRTQGRGLSPQARGDQRRAAAQKINSTLHLYEEPFLEIIEAHPGRPVAELDLGVAVQPLVRYVAGRVGGYSLEESREYYRLIIERAPREARSDGRLTFERQKVLDRNFGWVLLGDEFAGVLDTPELSYLPLWLRPPRGSGQELGAVGFAAWAQGVMDGLAGVVAEEDVKLTLGREEDATTATLLNDITRTTFYG
ncbi:MAG: hypothetical protein KIT46_03395 [Anaerolineales bacterium]|nr:hypothetical protein [Anaerolineales bacterium]MCW5855071.1 hypothetical protein [Anaerolineales bacterium]